MCGSAVIIIYMENSAHSTLESKCDQSVKNIHGHSFFFFLNEVVSSKENGTLVSSNQQQSMELQIHMQK